jgi:hypothetical protein
MDEKELMLDGNALSGSLRDVFAFEMSSARLKCAGCGQIEAVGAGHAFVQAPGLVLRCSHCEGVLLVLTHSPERYVIGFEGTAWLEITA